MLAPGDRHGDYVVDAVRGRGGSATVYAAHHAMAPSRVVALKVLDAPTPQRVARLHREFDVAWRLTHPQIVTVYEQGPGWLTMELLGGGAVTALERMPDRLAALADVAAGLDYAHDHGIAHGDVKPSNVLVHSDFGHGGAVLVDFGSARLLDGTDDAPRPAGIETSLPYAAPEILRGRLASAASDEYALACTAVELLTGAPPFAAATTMALTDAHLHRPVPAYARRLAWISHAFDSILAKAMAKDPAQRYPTCAEFVRLVTRALT